MVPFTVRYRGSIGTFRDRIACAFPDDAGRYTLVLWDPRPGDPRSLLDVRPQSIEAGGVTVWAPDAGLGPCVCRCGGNHNRWPAS